jgi:low affinity Fe/Cu permease
LSSINERFTDLADRVSEGMGRWQVSVIAFLLIAGWTISCASTQGPGWWYGLLYNMPLNLTTTGAELFIGFLLAAAANRSERHNKTLLEKIESLAEKIESEEAQEVAELVSIEKHLQGK